MRLIFAGTPEVASDALERIADKHEVTLVLTRPDAPIGRKRIMTPSRVASMAEKLGLRVHKTSKIDEEALKLIRESDAEKAVVVAYGAMIPEDGAVNDSMVEPTLLSAARMARRDSASAFNDS